MSGFAFKQFKVEHDQCAMKVSTDGILLGAWADLSDASSLLDIGTGTGLLALMCKQRVPDLKVSAVEVDEAAYQQAVKNCQQSPWPDISIYHQGIQHFAAETKFDCVISNPPYFNHSLKSDNAARNAARHTDGLSFAELIAAFKRLTHKQAHFNLILPSKEAQLFITLAQQQGLYLNAHCKVKTTPSKVFSRSLMRFSSIKTELQQTVLCIKDENNTYTADYVGLCKAFYLKM
ncbi:methyltransferase [Pseudoalteromonas sp. Scap03]|uniref:tRNA1(Val) (adenine(37)-N6)-methyltransferase n=1 Tax=unclassified Pseudoalteromonas TaxID=194690 RepID=UPI0015BF1ED8|nr:MULTISPECIES: methyltransferase [unclassified Pseudoalteromonas]NWL14328.1 methyltransferase [Pseudoalteromonas sp. Scap03]QLE82344.1 methyltransferase [Pseudoalteromonas sp. Scap25]QLE90286.1 methyltransferase [Pseudoalteromonas sp. Scap06]